MVTGWKRPEPKSTRRMDLSLSYQRRTRLSRRRGLIARIFHQGDGAGGGVAPNSLSCSKGDSEDEPLCEIIELGREALWQKRSDELAFDLLGLDGVWASARSETRLQ